MTIKELYEMACSEGVENLPAYIHSGESAFYEEYPVSYYTIAEGKLYL